MSLVKVAVIAIVAVCLVATSTHAQSDAVFEICADINEGANVNDSNAIKFQEDLTRALLGSDNLVGIFAEQETIRDVLTTLRRDIP